MRILIAGIDGYLGWPLAQHLVARGHTVAGIDAYLRRNWVEEVGSWSAIPISLGEERIRAFEENHGQNILFIEGDLRDYSIVERVFRYFEPEAIVHFGECPSAPYSMIDVKNAVFVQTNNITTTFNLLFCMRDICPRSHLVKLGTMGEYGTPNVEIPEGFFEIEYRGRSDMLPFPRQAGSWYHWSKVHGSNNIMFASRIWGLRATDIMQGVVFGTKIPEMGNDERLRTRFDFDQCFGTVINRYCAQAVIGHPLTPFGKGHQKRGFLPLVDSMQCLTLALENPPLDGEYRVFNQFEDVYDITELAFLVQRAGHALGLNVEIRNLENPRAELEDHFYKADRQQLLNLGYQPTFDIEAEIRRVLKDLMGFRTRIEARKEVLIPDIRWHGRRQKARFI